MPRGDNPNSRANLKPLQKGLPNKAQRDIQKKGSKAGNNSKKQYASLTEALKAKATPEILDQLTDMLIKKAKAGNLKAWELYRDQLGEKPTEKVAISTVNDEAMNRLAEAIEKRRSNG